MYDNSFYGTGNIGGWTVTIGDGGYGGTYPPYYPPYPSYPVTPQYPVTGGFQMDSTMVMVLVLAGVLLLIK